MVAFCDGAGCASKGPAAQDKASATAQANRVGWDFMKNTLQIIGS